MISKRDRIQQQCNTLSHKTVPEKESIVPMIELTILNFEEIVEIKRVLSLEFKV